MDGCNKVKSKKKDGMDRIKQAEKKKRRLEKALATSAAIRSELEKKKQKKKEEQQRLDEEGAAIAEAVALHVLHGEEDEDEDSDDSRNVISNKSKGLLLNRWDNLGMLTYNDVSKNPEYGGYGSYPEWPESMGGREGRPRYIGEDCWLDVAAQAVSALRISKDTNMY